MPTAPPNRSAIEKTARELVYAGRWADAISLYEELSRTGRNFGWLVERLKWRQSREAEYRRDFGNEAHRRHVEDHFREVQSLDVEGIDSAPAKVGFISVGAFVHTLNIRDGRALRVYEKIFALPDAAKVAHESQLFTHYPAEVLNAPAFFGTRTSGEFISAYYAFIDAVPIMASENDTLQRQLIQRFWALSPVDEIFAPEDSLYPVVLELIDKLETISIFRDAGQDAARIQKHLELVRDSKELIASTIARMPKFPFHRDLHADNILRDKSGKVFVIDWEKWSFEPIGFGWAPELSVEYALPMPDFRALLQARPLFEGFNIYHLLMMSSLWGLRNAIAKRSQSGVAWLERLAECCERAAMLESQREIGLEIAERAPLDKFEVLFSDVPKLYARDNLRAFDGPALRALKDVVETALDRKAWRIAETGAGSTTILFLLMQPNHVHSISSEMSMRDRILAYCDANAVPANALDFRHDRSELVLPDLAALLRKEQRKVDIALMGGLHGWPTVFVEFCYFNAMLRNGGLLVVDGVDIYSVAEFTRWLSLQPEYEFVKQVGQTMFYRKMVSSIHFKDFADQPYIVQQMGEA